MRAYREECNLMRCKLSNIKFNLDLTRQNTVTIPYTKTRLCTYNITH